MQLSKYSWTRRDFLYVDLFAGAGEFEDGNKGSVLLAADIMKSHIFIKRGDKVKNHFENFYILAIEKDIKAFNKLKNAIEKRKYPKKLDIFPLHGSWEEYHKDLKRVLKTFDWGFVFADPFSTELDILKFKDLLKSQSYTKMKDILIFFNLQTLKRQKGRKLKSDIERIKNTIGLSWEEIEAEDDLSDAVRKGIENNFSDIKDFAVGIAYPLSKKGKLTTMDYFYMVLLTNSYALIDLFLENYAKIIKENYPILKHQEKLFREIPFIVNKNQTLLRLWENEIDKFLSWKEIVKSGLEKIPTTKNIIVNLNELKKQNIIDFICSEKYIYRKNGKYGEKGSLNPGKIKSKEDLQSIQIEVVR